MDGKGDWLAYAMLLIIIILILVGVKFILMDLSLQKDLLYELWGDMKTACN